MGRFGSAFSVFRLIVDAKIATLPPIGGLKASCPCSLRKRSMRHVSSSTSLPAVVPRPGTFVQRRMFGLESHEWTQQHKPNSNSVCQSQNIATSSSPAAPDARPTLHGLPRSANHHPLQRHRPRHPCASFVPRWTIGVHVRQHVASVDGITWRVAGSRVKKKAIYKVPKQSPLLYQVRHRVSNRAGALEISQKCRNMGGKFTACYQAILALRSPTGKYSR
jgi:hypothetical protein